MHIMTKQAEKQTHTDHPARHWDRTCPACVEQAEEKEPEHWSDCAIYNEPAYHKGECNCGGYYKPIAYKEKKSDSIFYDKNNCSGDYIPLYTAPPKREWQGLAEREIKTFAHNIAEPPVFILEAADKGLCIRFSKTAEWYCSDKHGDYIVINDFLIAFANAIQNALQEKNT